MEQGHIWWQKLEKDGKKTCQELETNRMRRGKTIVEETSRMEGGETMVGETSTCYIRV